MAAVLVLAFMQLHCLFGQLVGTTRIAGGSSRHGIPWAVSLLRDGIPFCGGALITSTAVVTAAHCFEGFHPTSMSLSAVLGRGTPEQELAQVRHVFVHERFVEHLFKYDTAVVRLRTPARTRSFARLTRKRDYVQAKVVGWGLTRYRGKQSKFMQEASVTLLPDNVCLATLKYDPSLSLCAKGDQSDQSPCTGDSGGPLFVEPNRLIGTVSFGKKCRGKAIYSKISAMAKWIRKKAKVPLEK